MTPSEITATSIVVKFGQGSSVKDTADYFAVRRERVEIILRAALTQLVTDRNAAIAKLVTDQKADAN